MKIKDLENLLRDYSPESELVFLIHLKHEQREYNLKFDGERHHADSDTLALDFILE